MDTGDADNSSLISHATSLQNPAYAAAFIDIAFDAVVTFDARERITSWNSAAGQLFGWTLKEVLGKTPAKLFWPLTTPEEKKSRAQRQARLKRGETLQGEHDLCDKSGSRFRAQYHARAVFDTNGKFGGYVAVYRPVSAEMQVPEAPQVASRKDTSSETGRKFSALFDQIGFAAALLEIPTGVVVDVNDAWLNLFGFTREEVIGRTSVELNVSPNADERAHLIALLQEKGSARDLEITARTRSGELRNFLANVNAVKIDGQGYFLATAQNITERKQADDALRASEERYRAVIESALDAIIVTNPSQGGEVIAVNPAACKMFGYSQAEFVGLKRENMLALSAAEMAAVLEQRKQFGRIFKELSYIRKDGTRFTGEWSSALYQDKNGEERAVAIIRDATERKRTEAELEQSNQWLYRILESIQDDFYVLDRDWKFVFTSQSFTSKINKEPKDFIGNNIWEMFPKHIGTVFEANLRAAMQKGELRRFEIPGKYTNAWYRMTAFPSTEGITVLGTDITERKRVENTLQASQQMLETVVNHIPAAVCLIRGSDLRVQLVNPAYQAIAPGKEMLGHTLNELWPETGQDFDAICRRVLETGEPYEVVDELNMVRRYPDGALEPAYFSWSMYRVRLPDEGWGVLNTSWETTARRQAESALRESEERYRHLVKYAPAGIYEIDIETMHFLEVNDSMCQILGYTREELMSKMPDELLDEEGGKRFRERMFRALAGETIAEETEYKIKARNGSEIWAALNVTINYEAGKAKSVSVIAHDVTERRHAEDALRESESKYRRLHESMRDGFVFVSMSGKVKEYNETYRAMLGYEQGELDKLTYMDLTPEPWHALEQAIVEEQVIPRGYSEVYEKEYRRKDGTVFPVEMRAFLLKDENATNQGMWAIVRDITERKQAEQALRASEERLRRIIETSPIAIGFGDSTGKILDANLAFYRLTGYSREEIQASQLGWNNLTAPDYAELDQQLMAMVAATGVAGPYEKEYIRKDGSRVPLLVSLSKLSGADEHIAFLIDISERKRTQEALVRALNELYQHINNSPLAIVLFDSKYRIIEWSAGAERMFGWRAEEVLNKTIGEFHWVYEKDAQRVADLSANMLAGLELSNIHANRNYRKDGSLIHCEWYNSAVLDANGKLISVRSQVLDVTERKRAEEALRESATKLWLALNAGNLGIWDYDFGDEVFLDERSRAIYGLDPYQKIRLFEPDIVHPEDRTFVQGAVERAIAPSSSGNYHAEYRVIWRDGSIHWVSSNGQAYFAGEGAERHPIRFIGTVRDITRRKQSEFALRKSERQLQSLNESLENQVREKTAEVRYLAADLVKVVQRERHRLSHILHDDLQQRIYAIRTQMLFLRDVLESENEAARKEIAEIEAQLDEVRKITRNLSIDLSPPILRDEGLAHAINWLAAQMQQQQGLPIELRANEPFAIPDEELHILLFNCTRELLFNVVKHANASRAVVALQWVDGSIQIEVSDDGKGFEAQKLQWQVSHEMMDDDYLPTGLGLPAIRYQLGLFGGSLAVQSEPGAGTRVIMTVPITLGA